MKISKIICYGVAMATLAVTSFTANAQGMKVGDNPGTINPNSVLELQSTNKGFVAPRLALTQTTSSSPLTATLLTGTIVYNTATANDVTPGFYYWNGTAWQRMLSATSALTSNAPLSYNPSTGVLSISQANTSTDGYLSFTDWNTFNNKQNALTFGDVTSSTSGVTINNGTGAVIGSGTSISIATATGSQNGLLASTDWTTFNNKVTDVSGTAGNIVISGTTQNPVVNLATAGTAGTYTRVTTDAYGRVTAGANDLTTADITDFSISAPSSGQVLVYNSTSKKWENQTVSAAVLSSISGSAPITFNSSTGVIGINRNDVTSSDISITNGTNAVVGGANMTLTINKGDLTTTTSGITVGNGTGAVLGSGASINIATATGSQNGLLSSADWNTFNNKQDAGNYITALTGDATASGPGSAAITLATVNSNVGSFGAADQVSTFTVNAKGLITAAGQTSIQIAESQVTGLTSHIDGKVASVSGTSNEVDVTGTATAPVVGLANIGTAGTYFKVTTDAKGRVTSGQTTLSTGAITDEIVTVDGSGNLRKMNVNDITGVMPIATKSSNYTVATSDYTVICDASASAFTLTLPSASSNAGRVFVIIKADHSSNAVDFGGTSLKFTGGGSVLTEINFPKTMTIQSDGTSWWVINQY